MLSKPLRGRSINQRHWSADGLVGAWLFNEGCGKKVFDSSPYGNHGSIHNMASPPTSTSGWGAGRKGSELRFNGVSDFVNCGSGSVLDLTDAFTVTALVNLQSKTSGVGTFQGIVDRSNGTSRGYILLYYETTDRWRFYTYSGGWTFAESDSGATVNKWIHLVGTTDGDTVKLYIDGVLQAITAATGTITSNSNDDFIMGRYGIATSADSFRGFMDSIKVYNRALRLDEIRRLQYNDYAMFNPLFSPGILFCEAPAGLSIPVAMHHYEMLRA